MTPRRLLAVLLLALGAAGGVPVGRGLAAPAGASISSPLPADALPVPPPRQRRIDEALQQFAPAPVPDPDLQRPQADIKAAQPRTQVVPNLFTPPERRVGDGYVSGSAGTYDPDRRTRASPSLNLLVPLK